MSKCSPCHNTANQRINGEVNDGVNLGDGEGVFANKLGLNLQFKSLVGDRDISLSSTNEEITISSLTDGLYNKRIVVFGSSTAAGQGASPPTTNGWAYKMASALAPRGWTTINKAISGNTTQMLIDRFYTDVVPENPDLVIIATTLFNDGILGPNKDDAFKTTTTNIYKLADMCRKMGYKCLVTGTTPNDFYTSVEYKYNKDFNEFFENSEIPFINFLGAVDDGVGHWRPGMFADEIHANNNGHEALFRAIPLGIFDRIFNSEQSKYFSSSNFSSLNFNNTLGVLHPIVSNFNNNLGSFTVSFWVKQNSGATTDRTLFCFIGGDLPRIRNVGGLIAASSGDPVTDIITSTVNTNDLLWHHVLLKFDTFTNSLTLFVDGVSFGSAITSAFTSLSGAVLGGRSDTGAFNAANYSFRDLYISRVALNNQQIDDLYDNGLIYKGSGEIFTELTDNDNIYFQNRLSSDISIKNNLPSSTTNDSSVAILNQLLEPQTANWWINGKAKIGGASIPVQKFEVVGLDSIPFTSGASQNGTARFFGTIGTTVIDFGISSTNLYSWIQARDGGDYSINRPLMLNPNGGNIGIRTTNATHALTMSSTASADGFVMYNTADQTTNFERARLYWSGNIFNISTTEVGGTGSSRQLTISSTFNIINLNPAVNQVLGGIQLLRGSGASAQSSVGISGGMTATALFQQGLAILNEINQSGTAGFRALFISPRETTVGTGQRFLIDAGINSAVNGGGTHTSKFTVDNQGNIGYTTSASTPTTSDIVNGTFRMWKNTTSGELRWYANDGGVLKSVLLT